MLKKLLFILVSICVGILAYAGLQPPEYKIERSIAIKASPEKIFPYLIDSKLGEQWAKWSEVDPTTKMQFSGPERGVGAKTFWENGKQLGSGSATITSIEELKKVKVVLEYTQPMQMTQESQYLLEQKGNETLVTWSVTGKNTFISRLMCLFVSMDKIVGGMFEAGLGRLKTLVEGS